MKQSYKTSYSMILVAILLSLFFSACGGASSKKTYTIGVVNLTSTMDPILDGFKAGMKELGYVEGQNVTYLYGGSVANADALKPILDDFKNKKVDLVLAFGTLASVQAQKSLAGTDIPILFGPVTDPVKSGLVTDLLKPGGNTTGIRTGNPAPKRLEWLLTIVPSIKRIYVVNNPNDSSSVQGLALIQQTALTLGVELDVHNMGTPDEITAALATIPDNVDAIFMLASTILEAHMAEFVKAADDHKLPLSGSSTTTVRDGALMSFAQDNVPLGQQQARLAGQILRGIKPSDLPVESADLFTSLNLKTATIIGLNISDDTIRKINLVFR